jgi:hypothetical protein
VIDTTEFFGPSTEQRAEPAADEATAEAK